MLARGDGTILYENNIDRELIPASILKIATSLAAFHSLGEDFRYKTTAAFEKSTGTLYIKGFGDPLFISEQIRPFCRETASKLHERSIQRIDRIVLDNSYFRDDIAVPGKSGSMNPYDAPTGALCANFNTVKFKRDSSRRDYVSAEPQTPLLPFVMEKVRQTGLKKGRIILDREKSRLYPGFLIRHFLEENGIRVDGEILQGTMPENLSVSITRRSDFTLDVIVRKLLKYSNNFMANQLLLTIGARESGPPATLEKGVKAVSDYLSGELGLASFKLVEGSGISRENRISCREMISIVQKFKPYHRLLRKKGNEYFKTGTLSGVRTRAGFFKGTDDTLYPFVIMVNRNGGHYHAIKQKMKRTLQKRILQE
ncbi:MAG: D-alanyl-D-alanine carboxypeptidase [Desulfarculaceae bacterium]|nr:D-alanyl-D-alanine carboxypeptidase [Desulfarculaceae bacterium]